METKIIMISMYLQENAIWVLEDLGYEAKAFEDEEKVILVEKNAAMKVL